MEADHRSCTELNDVVVGPVDQIVGILDGGHGEVRLRGLDFLDADFAKANVSNQTFLLHRS